MFFIKHLVFYLSDILLPVFTRFTLEASKKKELHEALRGGGGQSDPPSTFDTIHPIDMKFGTYNKLHLYFQLHVVSNWFSWQQ